MEKPDSPTIQKARQVSALLKQLSDDEIEKIAPLFRVRNIPRGTTVLRPGEGRGRFGVVVSGELDLMEDTELKGNPLLLGRLREGGLLAHPTIFDVETPHISVVAHEESRLLVMSKESFENMLDHYPEIGIKILKEIIRVQFIRLRSMADRLAKVF